ncbi:hypothetical protein GCM10022236_10920 [Microlunatus ginsengisoli]|uniref:MmcQ/YjbR family DNA-binding protein n=1 Tax=Microlunatus ginsengisoli TaxID=363863 RepID=A0ABP6ZPB0_9ACTN
MTVSAVAGVVDADDVRRIASSLPHAVEIESDGFDFRVGNRGFVWSYPEYVRGRGRTIRTDIAVLYVGDEAEKQALLLSEPEVFFTSPAYDWLPLVLVRLAAIDLDRLTELITDAWHMRAPAELHLRHPMAERGRADHGDAENSGRGDVGSAGSRSS